MTTTPRSSRKGQQARRAELGQQRVGHAAGGILLRRAGRRVSVSSFKLPLRTATASSIGVGGVRSLLLRSSSLLKSGPTLSRFGSSKRADKQSSLACDKSAGARPAELAHVRRKTRRCSPVAARRREPPSDESRAPRLRARNAAAERRDRLAPPWLCRAGLARRPGRPARAPSVPARWRACTRRACSLKICADAGWSSLKACSACERRSSASA